MLKITESFQIHDYELDFSFVRSSGPGGQNVNKVNSKAVLRWNLLNTNDISPFLKTQLIQRLSNQLTKDGELLITSDRYRDQQMNREDCLEKLRSLLVQASHTPKARKETKPTFSSRVKTQVSKSSQANKKKQRRKPAFDD
jgi:ribosome-associated protein